MGPGTWEEGWDCRNVWPGRGGGWREGGAERRSHLDPKSARAVRLGDALQDAQIGGAGGVGGRVDEDGRVGVVVQQALQRRALARTHVRRLRRLHQVEYQLGGCGGGVCAADSVCDFFCMLISPLGTTVRNICL